MMNTCPKCEKIILSDYKFCPRCGNSLYGETPDRNALLKTNEPTTEIESDGRAIKFFNVAQTLSTATDVDQLLQKIGAAVEDILDAERSSIMLLDESGENLYFKSATGEEILKKLKIPVGKGVAGWIAKNRKPDIVNDPYSDERFSPDTDKSTGFKTKSIVGAPMIIGDELIGVAEAINKKEGEFSTQDMITLMGFAGLAAVTIVNTRLKIDQKNFFSNMLDFLVIGTDALGGPEPTEKGHSWKMAQFVPSMGREMGLDKETLPLIHHAALLHDIGFMGLENPELMGIKIDRELDDNTKYRLHPVIGAEMVKSIKIMQELGPFILYHHRFINGSGFPENIPPDKISPPQEIISILEEYFIVNNKEKIDPSNFSPEVYQAFIKTVP